MDVVYVLEHMYEIDETEEIKFIGVFSSEENAKLAIDTLKDVTGFKDYPIECFHVSKSIVDKICWEEGFIKWDQAME